VTQIAASGGDGTPAEIHNIGDKLWQAAGELCDTVDASEYKHGVLELLFLKHLSDSLESGRAKAKRQIRGRRPDPPEPNVQCLRLGPTSFSKTKCYAASASRLRETTTSLGSSTYLPIRPDSRRRFSLTNGGKLIN
jgi:hypothetical protein